jgi:hypothetical protein
MEQVKTGSRINSWLIDHEYLEKDCGIAKVDLDHFKRVCEILYYKYFITCPIPLFIAFDRNNKRFYFSVGDKFCLLPYKNNIGEYDYPELLQCWSSRFYPGYEIETVVERQPSADDVANLIGEGIDPDEAFNRMIQDKVIERCKVEKIVIKEDQITINLNGKKYIALSRPDKPISQFITNFRKIKDPYHRKAFLNEYTKNIMEVTYLKNIDVKIESVFMDNFFKIRVPSNFKFPLTKQDDSGFVYKWGRFTIFFARPDEVESAKKIIKYYKDNFRDVKNIDGYLKREFGMIFGVKNEKNRNKRR